MKENKTLITKATKQTNHQYNKQIHKNKNKPQTHLIDPRKYGNRRWKQNNRKKWKQNNQLIKENKTLTNKSQRKNK